MGPPKNQNTNSAVFIKLRGKRSRDNTASNRARAIAPAKRGVAKPSLFTWHHHEVPGVMMLVPTFINAAYGHFGGAFYWSIAFATEYKK